MLNFFFKSSLKWPLFIFVVLLNFFAAAIVAVLAGVLVIGVYHTLIYFIANALTFYLYLIIPLSTLFLAFKVPTLVNPVYSLLCLILVFFQIVVFYLIIGAEFLAFVFLIVYVGAIAILFLFVIMLLNVKELSSTFKTRLTSKQLILLVVLSLLTLNFVFSLSYAFETFFLVEEQNSYLVKGKYAENLTFFITQGYQDIFLFSGTLYNYYSYLFVLISFLLLTSMLGAIVLATSTFENKK